MRQEKHNLSDRDDSEANQLSLEEHYDRHSGEVYGFLLAGLGNQTDAEDLLQQCFLSLNARLSDEGLRNPRAYLFEIARNKTRDHFRRNGARGMRETRWLELAPDVVEPLRDIKNDERLREVEAALMTLPAEQRQVVALKIWQDMTFAQIAEIVDLSPNTVASRYRYALQALREVLPKESISL